VRAYARARGVSHTAVQKAIQSGRLAAALKPGPRGHQLIDEVLANQAWEEATNPAQQRERHRAPAPPRELAAAPEGQGNLFGLAENDPRGDPEERLTYAQIQAQRSLVQTELLRLELAEKRERLVERARVGSEVLTISRRATDILLALPGRLAGPLTGLATGEIRSALETEIRAALTQLADLLQTYDDEAPPA
jgi:hypothetical protein